MSGNKRGDFESLVQRVNRALGKSFHGARTLLGETQQQLAGKIGKRGNSHFSRFEKRGAGMGDVVVVNYITGHPERSREMVASGEDALTKAMNGEYKAIPWATLRVIIKDHLDHGRPSEAWVLANVLYDRAETDEEVAVAANMLGIVFHALGCYADAIGYYAKCTALEGRAVSSGVVLMARINMVGALIAMEAFGPARDLVEGLSRRQLGVQQLGFLHWKRAELAAAAGHEVWAYRWLLRAQRCFEALGNAAYRDAAMAHVGRLELLFSNKADRRERAERTLRTLLHSKDAETKGLASAFLYECLGALAELVIGEAVCKSSGLAAVRKAIDQAKETRRMREHQVALRSAVAAVVSCALVLALAAGASAKEGCKRAAPMPTTSQSTPLSPRF